MNLETVLLILLAVSFTIVGLFIAPRWRMRRAIKQVITIFKVHEAINPKSAETIDELGLAPQGFVGSMLRGRDYRQYAVQALINAKIVQRTEDDRLFLSEEKLMGSKLDRSTKYSVISRG